MGFMVPAGGAARDPFVPVVPAEVILRTVVIHDKAPIPPENPDVQARPALKDLVDKMIQNTDTHLDKLGN
jgi:hypothetical protein